MRRIQQFLQMLLLAILVSCNTTHQYPPAADALDAAREFIDASIKGDFEKANAYMLQDEKNKQLLKEEEEKYRAKTNAQQKQLSESSLQNISIEEVSATETIVKFKNSIDKTGRKVKVISVNNRWLVDFKYSFNPNL
jgi:ADP-ribosylglycohydrolase